MTDLRADERLLREDLAGLADTAVPDGQLGQIMAAVARTGQRPAWEIGLRGMTRTGALSQPRGNRASGVGSRFRPLVLAVVVGLLLLVMLLTYLLVGSPTRVDEQTTPTLGMPAQLYGRWEAAVTPLVPPFPETFHLDLGADATLSGPNDAPLPELSGAVEVTPHGDAPGTYAVRIAGPCGEGRYDARIEQTIALRVAVVADPCAERARILTGADWEPLIPEDDLVLDPLVARSTYDSGVFTEPFRFVMPAVEFTEADGFLETQFDRAQIYRSGGGIELGGAYWRMKILDDLPVPSDLCDPTSVVFADIPRTPEAVVAWFRDSGLPITEPTEVPVDGRTALRWLTVEAASPCDTWRIPAGRYFAYLDFAYAIPTGADTILVVGGSDDVNDPTVQAAVDELVRSMDFE